MPRKEYTYRGTRPKHAQSVALDEFSIYCELCECEYSVSRTTPVDQWLNRHQAHTDCLEKKALREAVVDEEGIVVRRYVRPRTLSSSDRVFVFEGVRQPTDKCDDDEISVQSGNDFEMDLPMDHDAEDEQIYEDYNGNVRGFFSEGFSAEEIGQPFLPHRQHQCTYNTVHMEELTRDKANLVTTDVAFRQPNCPIFKNSCKFCWMQRKDELIFLSGLDFVEIILHPKSVYQTWSIYTIGD